MKQYRSILCILAIALCSSVAFSSSTTYKVKPDYVKEYKYVFAPKTDLAYGVFHFDAIVPVNFAFTDRRDYTSVEYGTTKPQNKALPLSKRLWLMNCQIALK